MRRYFSLVLLMFFVVGCSSSPPCDTSQPTSQWHNCSGTKIVQGQATYIGEFMHGVSHGKGEIQFISGNKYVGEFRNNERHGQGTYTFANGDKYVGGFKDDKRHGYGTYTSADGKVWKGSWKNGEFKGKK